jgi:hypothetical protein
MQKPQVNWQPLSMLPAFDMMIDAQLAAALKHYNLLASVRNQPHLLDASAVSQSDQVFEEQREIVKLFAEQLERWRRESPTSEQLMEIDRLAGLVGQWGRAVDDILTLGAGLEKAISRNA